MTHTPTSGPLGRDSTKFGDKMARYHAAMENALYAAEIECNNPHWGSICSFKDRECPFKGKLFSEGAISVCKLRSYRVLLGDHVPQHDIPQVEETR